MKDLKTDSEIYQMLGRLIHLLEEGRERMPEIVAPIIRVALEYSEGWNEDISNRLAILPDWAPDEDRDEAQALTNTYNARRI